MEVIQIKKLFRYQCKVAAGRQLLVSISETSKYIAVSAGDSEVAIIDSCGNKLKEKQFSKSVVFALDWDTHEEYLMVLCENVTKVFLWSPLNYEDIISISLEE